MHKAPNHTTTSLPSALNTEVQGIHERQVRLRRFTLGLAAAAAVAAVGVVAAWFALRWAALPTHLTEVSLPYEVIRNTVQGSPGDLADPRQLINEMTQFTNSTLFKMIGLAMILVSGCFAFAANNFKIGIAGLIAGLNLLIGPSFVLALVDEPTPTRTSEETRGSIQSLADKGNFDAVEAVLGTKYTPASRALVLAQTALVRAGKGLSGIPVRQRIFVMQAAIAVRANPEEEVFAALPDATAYLIEMAAYGETRAQRATEFVDRMRSRAASVRVAGSFLTGLAAGLLAVACSVGGLSNVLSRRFKRIQDVLQRIETPHTAAAG